MLKINITYTIKPNINIICIRDTNKFCRLTYMEHTYTHSQ